MIEGQYKISYELLQGIVNYLATKPYNEVYTIIDTLSKLEEIKNVDKVSDTGGKNPGRKH